MRGLLVTVVVAAGALVAMPGPGEASGTGMEVSRAKVRLHRLRGLDRDRMKVRGRFSMLEGDFDPRYDRVDFLVAGAEVLCGPGELPPPEEQDPGEHDPTEPVPPLYDGDPYYYPGQPTDYGRPVPDPDGAPRAWSRQERRNGTWTFRTAGRRIDVNLAQGTFVVSGRNLDLDVLPDAGPGQVDLALVLGAEQVGAVIAFEDRGLTWSFRSE